MSPPSLEGMTSQIPSQKNALTMMRFVAAAALLVTTTTAFTLYSSPFNLQHSTIVLYSAAADELVPKPAAKTTASASIPRVLSRADGQALLDDVILPERDYGSRIETGRDAQGLQAASGVAVSPQDPRMFLTYGEFPLSSLDELLDLALLHVKSPSRIEMVDVGSGCGRLALYAALTRGGEPSLLQSWQVHGIEISPILHHEAVQALSKAAQAGLVQDYQPNLNDCNSILLHAGAAEEWTEVLGQCNLGAL